MDIKQFDVYMTADGNARVYPRGEIDAFGELPDGEPLYTCDADTGDWWEWCETHCGYFHDETVRTCKLVGTYPATFAADLERKAQELFDTYRTDGEAHGWGSLEIDHSGMNYTFRATAAWKESPTLYTFSQPLRWTNEGKITRTEIEHIWTRDNLIRLQGMADAAHELGLNIVYDAQFKIHLMGRRQTWETKFED